MKRCLVHIVTFNHGRTIGACLESLRELQCPEGWSYEVFISDNASSDNTRNILRDRAANGRVAFFEYSKNLGFCAAHNLAIQRAYDLGVEAVLVLNPDVALAPDCLFHMLRALETDSQIGSVTPKLLRCDETLTPQNPANIDAAGMWITPECRHFDRGSGELDRGQYNSPVFVFGGSGAALLLGRRFIEDAAFSFPRTELRNGTTRSRTSLELFDEAFFAYREDADLAWRSALLGWKCRYEPAAIAYHVRRVLPERRDQLPPELNLYSVRNRFLLQLNNFSARECLRCLLPTSFRNLLVVGGVLLAEHTSRPALGEAIALRERQLLRRRWIRGKCRAAAADVTRWFAWSPQTQSLLAREAGPPINSVAVVIVNYNSGPRLEACVRSLLPLLNRKGQGTEMTAGSPYQSHGQSHGQSYGRSYEIELVIIDNASTDNSTEALASLLHDYDARLVRSPTNLGFAGGVNAGAIKTTADAILVLNPDVIPSAESIQAQVTALNAHSNLGAVAPIFVTATGVLQTNYCARRFPTLLPTLLELLGLHQVFPRNFWSLTDRYLDDKIFSAYLAGETPTVGPYHPLDRPFVVEQPSAACLLIRRSAYMQVGGFDEGYQPAWFEDVDFCRKLNSADWQAAVTRQAQVIHEGGYSLKVLSRSRFVRIWYRNLFRYWRSNHSLLAYLLVRTAATIGLSARAALALGGSFIVKSEGESSELRDYAWGCLRAIFGLNVRQN